MFWGMAIDNQLTRPCWRNLKKKRPFPRVVGTLKCTMSFKFKSKKTTVDLWHRSTASKHWEANKNHMVPWRLDLAALLFVLELIKKQRKQIKSHPKVMIYPVEHQNKPEYFSKFLFESRTLACDMEVSDIFLMYSIVAQCTYQQKPGWQKVNQGWNLEMEVSKILSHDIEIWFAVNFQLECFQIVNLGTSFGKPLCSEKRNKEMQDVKNSLPKFFPKDSPRCFFCFARLSTNVVFSEQSIHLNFSRIWRAMTWRGKKPLASIHGLMKKQKTRKMRGNKELGGKKIYGRKG